MHHYHHHYYRYISDKQSQVFIKSRPLIFRIKSPRKQCCWLISLSCVWQVREGMWLKYQIFIQNVRKLRGPLSAIQKFHPPFSSRLFFTLFFRSLFWRLFACDFFSAICFKRLFFWRLFVATSTEGSEHGTCGKMAISTSSSTGVIGLCLLRNPLWAKILSSWRRHNAVREHKEG